MPLIIVQTGRKWLLSLSYHGNVRHLLVASIDLQENCAVQKISLWLLQGHSIATCRCASRQIDCPRRIFFEVKSTQDFQPVLYCIRWADSYSGFFCATVRRIPQGDTPLKPVVNVCRRGWNLPLKWTFEAATSSIIDHLLTSILMCCSNF
jgi:hypothetical protein